MINQIKSGYDSNVRCMEVNEESIEIIEEKFKKSLSSKLASLSSLQIADVSSKYRTLPSTIDLLEIREKFIADISKPMPIPKPYTFSQQLIDSLNEKIDGPSDTSKTLKTFFTNEIKRVKKKQKIMNEKCRNVPDLIANPSSFTTLIDEFTKHLLRCQEGLTRLSSATMSSYNVDDVQMEFVSAVTTHRKDIVLNSLLSEIKSFPLSHRTSIYQTLFDKVCNIFEKNKMEACITTLPSDHEWVENDLIRLSNRFGIEPDFNFHDGQRFLYSVEKKYDLIWKRLTLSEFPRKAIEIPTKSRSMNLSNLTYQSLLANVSMDLKLYHVFENIKTNTDINVKINAKEQSQFYNTFVAHSLKIPKLNIPPFKIQTWLQLRWTHMRFLWELFVSQINFFQYITLRIMNPETDLKSRVSERFKEVFEVYDSSGPFVFKSTDTIAEQLTEQMIRSASHYIYKFECIDNNMIDRESVAERLLLYECRLFNAKYELILPLLEIIDHSLSRDIIQTIISVINARPNVDHQLYMSFEIPYDLLIETMEEKARAVRALINAHILHERQIAPRLTEMCPLFDRPSMIGGVTHGAKYPGGVPLTVFEIYERLGQIKNIVDVVDNLCEEMACDIDLRETKFGDYMEYSIWHEINKVINGMTANGILPYERVPIHSEVNLSDSVNSLFTSPYLSSIESIGSLIETMNEGRKLRFVMACRRLMSFTWGIQNEILQTTRLKSVYFEQCAVLGMSERTTVLPPFDLPEKQEQPDFLLDFAINEFHPTPVDFSNITYLKDMLFSSSFEQVETIFRFQRLQNIILETCVRFNASVLDVEFVAKYFCLYGNLDNAVFVTGTTDVDPGSMEDRESIIFFKKFVSTLLFYSPTTIVSQLNFARSNKHLFQVNIKNVKTAARLMLTAHTRNLMLPRRELQQMYESEILDAFLPYLYRVEIVKLSDMERRILSSNSFVDTFLIGPIDGQLLINEAGRFENFFYIPCWTEVMTMMQTAPGPRQSAVLKFLVPFLATRLQIITFVRYLVSIEQPGGIVLDTIYNDQFNCESPYFQKMANDCGRLPSGREVDVMAQFLDDKLHLMYRQFELSILETFETSFVSVSKGLKNGDKPIFTAGVKELEFGESLKRLFKAMHEPLKTESLCPARYIPLYQMQFCYEVPDGDKQTLQSHMFSVEQFLERSLVVLKSQTFMDTFQMIHPSIEFAEECISRFQMKFAYFQMLDHAPIDSINALTSVTNCSQKNLTTGFTIWNDGIVKEALKKITLKGETVPKAPNNQIMMRFVKASIEILSDHIDTLIVQTQVKNLETEANSIIASLDSKIKDEQLIDLRPDLYMTGQVSSAYNLIENNAFTIPPNVADSQFDEELKYAHSSFVTMVSDMTKECVLKSPMKSSTISIDNDRLENIFRNLSESIRVYFEGSLHDQSYTWKQYLQCSFATLQSYDENDKIIEVLLKVMRSQHKSHTAYEIGNTYRSQFEVLNHLRQEYHSLISSLIPTDRKMEEGERVYFDLLVSDLGKQINLQKAQFYNVRRRMYSSILKSIEKGRGTEIAIGPHVDDKDAKDANQRLLEQAKAENERVRVYIKKLRILKVLKNIATCRFFGKKLAASESDRFASNAMLWSNRLLYETHGAEMEEQLTDGHKKLSDIEEEIEVCKIKLENEKLANIQLVQWKATNANKVKDLQKAISKVESPEDQPSVGELLKKLSNADSILESLEPDTNALEESIEAEVRRPMTVASRMRASMTATRISRMDVINKKQGREQQQFKSSYEYMARMDMAREENERLLQQNDIIRGEIEKIEQKLKFIPRPSTSLGSARSTSSTVSRRSTASVKTVQAPPSMYATGPSKVKPQTIVKPSVRPTTRQSSKVPRLGTIY